MEKPMLKLKKCPITVFCVALTFAMAINTANADLLQNGFFEDANGFAASFDYADDGSSNNLLISGSFWELDVGQITDISGPTRVDSVHAIATHLVNPSSAANDAGDPTGIDFCEFDPEGSGEFCGLVSGGNTHDFIRIGDIIKPGAQDWVFLSLDLNGDGTGTLSFSGCHSAGGICAAPPVPVPAAVWLLGSGLLGLAGLARRKRMSAS
jgi:hypothetical protein